MVAESLGRFQREFVWTLGMGALTATLAVVVAAPLAWLARRGGWRSIPALGVAAVGVAIPGPVIAMGLIHVLNREASPWLVWLYDRTLFAPTAAMLIRTSPWAILICWFAFRSLPPETLEMAELDGAGPWTRFLWIAAPQRWSALALAWLVALVVATGDLAASILVVPPGVDLLSVRIFTLIHAGVDDLVAGVCLAIVVAVVALAALVWLLLRWFGASAMLLADER
jgi:ABC-type Fe3+ transport system permease subunit